MKKVTQKALSLLLSFTMLLGMAQGVGLATASAKDSGVTAYYCDSGLYRDSQYTQRVDPSSDYSFQNSITSIVVKDSTQAIGDDAFWSFKSLTDVSIPDSVKTIGKGAFSFCSSLTSVTFAPGSLLQKIGPNAFGACASLPSIDLPASVDSIGQNVFLSCSDLTEINVEEGNTAYSSKDGVLYSEDGKTLITCPEGKSGEFSVPDSVTDIGADAFAQCSGLNRILISDFVKSIGDEAFFECGSLASIEIPASVGSIGGGAFTYCSKLAEIDVDSGNTAYSSKDGVLYSNADGKTTLITCPEAKTGTLTVPDDVTDIAEGAFEACTDLTRVAIPGSVQSIGDGAFWYCERLSTVTFGADSRLETIGQQAFGNCFSLVSIELPASVGSVGIGAFDQCGSLKSVALTPSDNLTGVNSAFTSCDSLRNLYVVGDSMPDTLPVLANTFQFAENGAGGYRLTKYTGTKVGILIPKALYGKDISPSIDPDSLGKTETTAYYNGTGLYKDEGCQQMIDGIDSFRGLITDIDFTDGVTSIDDSSLNDCSSLTGITIPASVTSVDNLAFEGCSELSEINVEDGNTVYSSEDGVLYNQDKTSLIICPEGKSGTVSIPEGITGIENTAFQRCAGLTGVTIPASVASLDELMFDRCDELTEISVEDGNANYSSKDGVLYSKDGKTLVFCPEGKSGTFSVPDGVAAIGRAAFEACIGLTDVAIPESVVSIGEGAFYNCIGLTRVALKGASVSISKGAFSEGPDATVTFLVPAASVAYYQGELDSNVMEDTTANVVGERLVTAISGLPGAKAVANGTAQTDLNLPSSLTLTIDGQPRNTDVAWTSSPEYDPNQAGTYTFTPVLPVEEGYALADGVSAAISVTVESTPVVSGVTVTPSVAALQRGASQQFIAAVMGTNSPSQNVTWSVTGKHSSGTEIDQTGKLTVGSNESASALTVKAVSVSDTGKYGTAAVTVTNPQSGDDSDSRDHSGDSSSASSPSLPVTVQGSVSGTQADLSGATFPSSVTGVSLSVTPETPSGIPAETSGGTTDPQGSAAYNFAVSDTALNIIGTPFLYNLKLLDQSGNPVSFTGSVTVRIPVPSGIHGTPHVYRYEPDGTLTDLGATVQDGYLVFTTTHFSYYIVAGTGDSITLDTTSYQMPVGGKYQIGMKLTGTKAVSVKFYSTNDKTATAAKLKNGNYLVTGKSAGTVWIMFDVYDNKNKLLTHVSSRVDVKTGIRPRGDSTRQIGVY